MIYRHMGKKTKQTNKHPGDKVVLNVLNYLQTQHRPPADLVFAAGLSLLIICVRSSFVQLGPQSFGLPVVQSLL